MATLEQDWYKDGDFWRHPDSGWFGDLIYNTMSRIIDMEDKSKWANKSFDTCKKLLSENKRWPDRFNTDSTAKNRIQWWWSKLLKTLRLKKYAYYRPQNDMTRDPYVAVIACAFHLGRPEEIQNITIPWYLFSWGTWAWFRTLKNDRQPLWVQRLDYYRALSVVIKNSSNINILENEEDINN